jgi:Fur family transcriptional regulator, ferric uptake regulator
MEAQDYKELFAKYDIKNTRQRNFVFDILNHSQEPRTAEQIYMKVRILDETISMSTVYRILDVFMEKDLVIKTNITSDHKALFEVNRKEHRHFLICTSCKKMVHIEDCPLSIFEAAIETKTGFTVTGHRLEVLGRCYQCKNR